MASKEKGVYRYDGHQLLLFTKSDSLCSTNILSVQEDDLGNLYFDTPSGVSKYDGQSFTTLPLADKEHATSEWVVDPDDLWFRMGWEHSGPFRYDGDSLYHLTFPKNDIEVTFYEQYPNVSYNPYGIYDLFEDSKGNIWMGTANFGIYFFDGTEISWMYEEQLTTTPAGGAFGIRSIAEDKEGYYWICNANLKYQLSPPSKTESDLKPLQLNKQIGIPDKTDLYFQSISVDQQGNLWMSSPQGVWRNDGHTLEHITFRDADTIIKPNSVYIDLKGDIWLGTEKQGIYTFDGKRYSKFEIWGT